MNKPNLFDTFQTGLQAVWLCFDLDRLPCQTVRRCLFWIFTLAVFLFPLGQAFQVAGPLICLGPLVFLYWKDWNNCTLRHLPVRGLFFVFFGCVFLQLALSHWMGLSWRTVSPLLYRSFLFPFIAMESIREEKDLRRLIITFACASFYEGLDGIWQYVTGFDFIKHQAWHNGRLTGSLGTYRVGDYMGLILLPACGVWMLLPGKNSWLRAGLTVCLLFPALFLWVFAQARIGYLALTLGLFSIWLLIMGHPNKKIIAASLAFFILLAFVGPQRISLELALQDPRTELWSVALQAFLHSPWFGTGAGTYIPALQEAGQTLVREVLTVQHPHNIYLQLLVDGGVVSLVGIGGFLFFMAGWGWRQIRRGVRHEQEGRLTGHFWHLAAFFWAGWIGYLIVGLAGHDFYRTWFMSTGMIHLGVFLAACVHGKKATDDKTVA